MGMKGDLNDFEHGMVAGTRWPGLSVSESVDLVGFSRITISRVYIEWSKKRLNIQWAAVENALLMSEESVQTCLK